MTQPSQLSLRALARNPDEFDQSQGLRWLKRGCLTVLLGLSLTLCGLWGTARPASTRAWFEGSQKPLILAHQGGEREWPSNTMEAFRQALKAGCEVLDMDLHLSQDGVLVLMHDTSVDRTTNGSGAIRELTWNQLEKLDAGYSFSPDGKTYPYRGKGLRIPRLEEVLQAFPDTRLGIEVKQAPLETAEHLARLLAQYRAESRVLLASFEQPMMNRLRQLCPQAATSATPQEVRLFVVASQLHLEGLISPSYQALQIPMQREGWQLVTPALVRAAHRRGIKVIPWTIDQPRQAEECFEAGVDGLNTNLPTAMLRLRNLKRSRVESP